MSVIFKMPVRPEKCRCLLHEFRTSLVRTTEIRHVAPDAPSGMSPEDALRRRAFRALNADFSDWHLPTLRIFLPDQFKLSRTNSRTVHRFFGDEPER